jgi:mannose-6-phosphate isomerase-like protein (cupin superfamily)
MAAIREPAALPAVTDGAAFAWFRARGMTPHTWANAPGDAYAPHAHDYHKVLLCLRGGIVFHTADGDVELRAGDRLDVEPGTVHSAAVGPAGVACMEAPLPVSSR